MSWYWWGQTLLWLNAIVFDEDIQPRLTQTGTQKCCCEPPLSTSELSVSDKGQGSSRAVAAQVKHSRRPRTAVEGSLENSCRQDDVILGGVVVRVHSGRGHAPSTKERIKAREND